MSSGSRLPVGVAAVHRTETAPAVPVDVHAVSEAYDRGLSIFCRVPATRREVLELRDELRRYIDVLGPEAMVIVPRMRGEMREAGVHAVVRNVQLLEELGRMQLASEDEAPLDGPPSMRDRDHVFELATVARSYLAVVARPGPLGESTGPFQLQAALGRRVCAACCQPIADGEPVEWKVFASNSTGGTRAAVHAELCGPRRPVLLRVPVQPSHA